MAEVERNSRPQERIIPQAAMQGDNVFFVLGVAVVSLLVLGYLILVVMGFTYDSRIRSLNSAIDAQDQDFQSQDIQDTYKTYLALNNVDQHIKQLQNLRFIFMPTWTTVKKSIPKDVQFTSVSIGQDYVFRITGVTRSITSVANFAKQLGADPNLTQITPLSVDKQSNNDTYNFTLSFKAKAAKTAKGGGV